MMTLIVNPTAGNGYALRVENMLRGELDKRGLPYRIVHTEGPGHATLLAQEAAHQAECGSVIAVGGDGTAYEVACGLTGTAVPLGIIPAGTGNDFIKTTGTPSKPLEALDFILTHEPRPVDIGGMNERLFLNVCGTGFDVTVLDYTLAAKKYVRGLLPYMIGLIRAIFHYRPVHVRYTVDGAVKEKDVLICSIANGRFIGGGIPICPAAQPDDGLLDLVVVDSVPRHSIPRYLPSLMRGKILGIKPASHQRCSRVELESPGMRLNVDGEILDMDRVTFTIRPGCLRLYW